MMGQQFHHLKVEQHFVGFVALAGRGQDRIISQAGGVRCSFQPPGIDFDRGLHPLHGRGANAFLQTTLA
jgi:hypothetical protein